MVVYKDQIRYNNKKECGRVNGMNEKRNRLLKIGSVLIVVLVLFYCAMISNQKQSVYRYTDSAMSTAISFQLYGKNAEQTKTDVMRLLHRLEKTISWREPDSKIAKLNQMGFFDVETASDKTFKTWIEESLVVGKKSDGALDVTVLPLAKAWNIESDVCKIPNTKDILLAQERIGLDRIKIKENKITLDAETKIDLGAVGKGIALDEIYDLLVWDLNEENSKEDDENVQNDFAGTISVGGSILAKGSKPDGTKWNLGIQDPRANTGETMGIFSTNRSCMVSTSGDYEKYFEQNGKRYHHILDGKTGYPSESGLISVSILFTDVDQEKNQNKDALQGLLSDGLSTACFVLGKDKGMNLIQEYQKEYSVEAIFIDQNKGVYITSGLKDSFKITNEEYHFCDK